MKTETEIIETPETKKPDRSEWIELHSWESEIEKVHRRAAVAESALNELYQIAGIKSRKQLDEAKHAHGEGKWIPSQLLLDKKVRDLAHLIDVNTMLVPLPLQRAAILLGKELDLSFLEFDGIEWLTNLELLEDYCDKQYRTFASTKEALQKIELLSPICAYLNSLDMGVYSKNNYISDMVDFDPVRGFTPCRTFVLANDSTDFKN